MTLALHVLGPAELLRDGRALAWPSRKAVALLLRLALAGPQTRPALVALLWPGHDETTGRRNLRRELARLRDGGAADVLASAGDRLALAPAVRLDATAFVALLERQDAEAALALWRGPLADGLELAETREFTAWLAGERERLHARWRDALAVHATTAEAAGRHDQARVALERLLADDPLQEHHHRHLMQLHAAAGRREAALQQFEQCRRLLADELGLQPMPETLALARSLRDEPAPPAALLPRRVWPGELPFVGREHEVARLQQAFAAGRPIVLAGPAGVGKTRLAVDFAASLGAYAWVRCQPGDAELPFGAYARVLRVLAGQPPDLRGLDGWIVAELARVLPELGTMPPALRNEGERLRFDEACIRAWHVLSRGAFDAIVLDDWHLADAGSRTLLARAAARRREAGPGGAIEILAWRGAPDDPGLPAEVEGLAAECLALQPLPPAAVHSLVRQLTGADDPARFAARLTGATGGLPYFIAETLRDLSERGLLQCDARGRWSTPFDADTADYHELPLAPSVRDAVLARVRRLHPATARLLDAAALAGEPFGAARLASACALSELEALQAMDECARAQLVQPRDGGGFGWAHDLARQAIDAALPPARRRLLHHRLALAAETLGDAAGAARHFEACGEPSRAAPHRRAAGDAAHALHALGDAAAHWRQGLADEPVPDELAALLGRLVDTTWAMGLGEEAAAHHARLQALLDAHALPPPVRTDALLHAARYLHNFGRPDAAMRLLETLPEPDEARLRHRWWVVRLSVLQQCGRLDEALAVGLQALASAGAALRERAELLGILSTVQMFRGEMVAGAEQATAALALYARLQDDAGRARALYQRGCCHTEHGDLGAGAADLRHAATLARQCGHVYLQRVALYNLATIFSNQTRPEEALAVAREAWATMAGEPASELSLIFRTLFIECHHIRGEWAALWLHLEPALDEALAAAQPMVLLSVANAALEPAAALGQWDRVRPLVAALETNGSFESIASASEVMLACAQSALIRRDAASAAAWLDRAAAVGDRERVRVQARLAVLRAHLSLLAGNVAADGLPADDAPGMNAELRLRALALRCAAAPTPVRRRQAQAALADPQAHAGALLLVAQVVGAAALEQRVERHAAELAGLPGLQAGLRATWLGGPA